MRSADVIVKALEAQKLKRLYCVPGESYLPLLDALHDCKLQTTVVCRHESGAGFMAVAEAKMTGRPRLLHGVARAPAPPMARSPSMLPSRMRCRWSC